MHRTCINFPQCMQPLFGPGRRDVLSEQIIGDTTLFDADGAYSTSQGGVKVQMETLPPHLDDDAFDSVLQQGYQHLSKLLGEHHSSALRVTYHYALIFAQRYLEHYPYNRMKAAN